MPTPDNGVIYMITHRPTGRRYIGQAIDHHKRWKQHVQFDSSSLIHLAIEHYGVNEFDFEVIETVHRDLLTERENYHIKEYRTETHGFNNMTGISNKVWLTPEERQFQLNPYYKPKGYFDVLRYQ